MAKRVILQGWFGMQNFGDDLLLEVTLRHLRASLNYIRIDVIGEGAKRPDFLPKDVKYIPRASRKWGWLRRRWLRSGADWVLCGGSVLQEDVLQRFIEPATQVKKAGGRVFLHAIGLREKMLLTPQLQALMDNVDAVSVRERAGWEILSQFGDVTLVADPVFAMQIAPQQVKPDNLLIALRGSVETESNLDYICHWIRDISGDFSAIEVMVCFPAQDLSISQGVVEKLADLNVKLLPQISAFEMAKLVAQAGQLITMRLHPAIVSLAAGNVPWVLHPEHKQQALMIDVGHEDHLLSWDNVRQKIKLSRHADTHMEKFIAQGQQSLDLLSSWINQS